MIFKFDFKPLSHNMAYKPFPRGRSATIIKTRDYRLFEKKIRGARNIKAIKELEKFYNPEDHGIVIVVDIYLKDMFIKPRKKGEKSRLSKTSFDCGNGYKATVDSFLGDTEINDAYIVKYTEEKHQSEADYFTIDIKVVDLEGEKIK